ncbi:MAG: peptidylprolyl isomerase [Stagnimonas sp.]|nr:peptidylprolyl isomerase [Stagnimonas sp.]
MSFAATLLRSARHLRPELSLLSLGALAFLVDAWTTPLPAGDPLRIRLPDAEERRRLPAEDFGEVPTADAASLEQWLRSEVLYREARRLGLDNGDVIVRRRLVQKMEYLLDGMSKLPELSRPALERYYSEHAERYREPERYQFVQLFFNSEQGLETARSRALAALPNLRGKAPTAASALAGDPYPGESRLSEVGLERVVQLFGAGFAESLTKAPLGQWSGPYRSRHGLHLVHLQARSAPALPPLDRIYPSIARDYIADYQRREREQRYSELRQRYQVEPAERAEAKLTPGHS